MPTGVHYDLGSVSISTSYSHGEGILENLLLEMQRKAWPSLKGAVLRSPICLFFFFLINFYWSIVDLQ